MNEEQKSHQNFLWGSIASFVGFALTAYLLFEGSVFGFIDSRVLGLFISIQNSFLTKFMVTLDFLTGEIIFGSLIILLAAVFFYKKARREALLLAIPVFVGGAAIKIFKDLFEVTRPNVVVGDVLSSFGFPSGHTTLAFLILPVLGYVLLKGTEKERTRKIIIWGFSALALLIAFSRLYLGVHWFSDVLAGVFLGTGIALLSIYFYRR